MGEDGRRALGVGWTWVIFKVRHGTRVTSILSFTRPLGVLACV